jgi:ribosomal protein S18 acetylase RimI-like enzyme
LPTELVHPPTETLGRHHNRAPFSCEVPDLDTYLRERALQDQKRRSAVCWVLPYADAPRQIRGYYTLSAYAVGLPDLPEEQARKLPKYPTVPAALLGRLAVDHRSRGQRVGEHLLMDALAKVLQQAATMAIYALVVDAKDDQAAAFYARYDFIAFPSNPLRLFLPTATIAQLFE